MKRKMVLIKRGKMLKRYIVDLRGNINKEVEI
jgi:hypothetical protein